MPSVEPCESMDSCSESSNEREVDIASPCTQTGRVLKELQIIRRSQKHIEALLGRILNGRTSSTDCPSPEPSVFPPTHQRKRVTRKEGSAIVTWSDSSATFETTNSGQTNASTPFKLQRRTQAFSPVVGPFSMSGMNSSDETLQGQESGRRLETLFSKELAASSSFQSNDGTFIAATLPLSWPTVVKARTKYDTDKSASQRTLIKHTVVACSRIWADRSSLPSLQTRNWNWRQSCIIYPGSTFHMCVCILSCVVLLYDFALIPVILAWDVQMNSFLRTAGLISVMFWTIDIGMTFLTAFYMKGELIVSPAAIAKRYFRTWFSVDFAAALGDWASVTLHSLASTSSSSVGNMRLMRLVKIARLIRIIGVLRMLRFLNKFREYFEKQCSGYYRMGVQTVSLMVGFFLFTHTMCCTWYAVGKLGPSDTGTRWTDMFDGSEQFSVTSGGFLRSLELSSSSPYEYLTSFNWAAAQMMLGATDVNGSNSLERCVTVVCMLIGMLFSSTLVSSLSATLVDINIAHKDQTQKIDAIRRYLKENYISATTCLMVEDQVLERLQQERRGRFYEAEACMQHLISRRLFAKLRHEVFLPSINTHPLLCIWSLVHEPTIHRLAVEAFDFKALQVGDDLFVAGGKADAAYFIIQGQLDYTQRPDSSPLIREVTDTLGHGTWLCEAALWSEWIHVGTAVATQRSTLVVLKAEELLKVSREHAVVKTIVASYGEVFHRRITCALPPEERWPNDLVVPRTSLAHIVISMPREAQVAISWNVLHRFSGQIFGLSGWAAKAFGGSSARQLQRLEEEVTLGRSVVIKVDGEVQRVASTVCLRLLDDCHRVLVQIGRCEDGVDGVDPVCQLPGQKVDVDFTVEDKLAHVLDDKLPLLSDDMVSIQEVENDETQELSRFFLLKTTYFRTIITASLLSDFEAEKVPLAADTETIRHFESTHRRLDSTKPAPLNPADSRFLESLLPCTVHCVEKASSMAGLYVWLYEDVFKKLRKHSAGQAIVTEWIHRLSNDYIVHGINRCTSNLRPSVASHFSELGDQTHRLPQGAVIFPTDYEQELVPPARLCASMRRSTEATNSRARSTTSGTFWPFMHSDTAAQELETSSHMVQRAVQEFSAPGIDSERDVFIVDESKEEEMCEDPSKGTFTM